MISVCIATYNGESYLRQQLETILCQLGEEDEVIISDDSSTDMTLDIIRSFNDTRIKVFAHEKKVLPYAISYPIRNFENALQHASGDYIFLADQDDVWLENKVQVMMAALEDADLVLSDCKVTDGNLNVLVESFFEVRHTRLGILANLKTCYYQGSCLAFRRCVLEKALPFPSDMVGHDLWLGLIAESYFRVKLVNEQLMLYRRHDDCVTPSGFKSPHSLWFKIAYRMVAIKSLLFRRLANI